MVSFNNLCLQYVEVSFYQVARSLTICFTIVFTYTILGKKTSLYSIEASGVVFIGFIIGSIGEIRFTMHGTVFGVLSSAFVALNGIFVSKIIAVVNNDEQRLIIYNTILAIIFLIPLLLFFNEVPRVFDDPLLYKSGTWIMMIATGIFGFLINIATYLQIKFTSPLTHNISGTAKAAVQTILGIMIYKNPVSLMNGTGIVLVLGGSLLYSYIRIMEMKK